MSTYKACFLAHAKNEHIIFPDEISHIMSVIGLKSGKKSIKWLSVGILDLKETLKLQT